MCLLSIELVHLLVLLNAEFCGTCLCRELGPLTLRERLPHPAQKRLPVRTGHVLQERPPRAGKLSPGVRSRLLVAACALCDLVKRRRLRRESGTRRWRVAKVALPALLIEEDHVDPASSSSASRVW